jgi:hypothetical protein
MAALRESGMLYEYEQERYDAINKWFNERLNKPSSFSRSSRPGAKNVALSWFKDTAKDHIEKMHEVVSILDAHDIPVEVIRSNRPGYIVYEDEFQVAAEPFQETVT